MNKRKNLRTETWLLRGIGSLPGILVLDGGRISFQASGSGTLGRGQLRRLEQDTGRAGLAETLDNGGHAIVFNADSSELRNVNVPWYYLSGGITFTIDGVDYRFSFTTPPNMPGAPNGIIDTITDLTRGRKIGKAWQEALMEMRDNAARLNFIIKRR